MADKLIPQSQVLSYFKTSNLNLELAIPLEGLKKLDFDLIKRASKQWGSNTLVNFFRTVNMSGAFNQLRAKIPSVNERKLFVLREFYKPLTNLIRNPKLGKNYFLSLQTPTTNFGPEESMGFMLELRRKEDGQKDDPGFIMDLHFDLRFSEQDKPMAVVAHGQGKQKKIVDEFELYAKDKALNFMIKLFNDSFEKEHLRALNPRSHPYRTNSINPLFVANSMESRGELTKKQKISFADWHTSEGATHCDQKIIGAVMQRTEQISRINTGKHISAYKGAGYKITKSIQKNSRHFLRV